MSHRSDDPLFRHARREAAVVLILWALCGLYAIPFCIFSGYGRPPREVTTTLGIPDWVLFGVIAPWLLVNVFAWWFCFRFVEDDDLDSDAGEPVDGGERPGHAP